MDQVTVRVITMPLERLMENDNLDAPEDVLVELCYSPAGVGLLEIENTIVDTFHEFGCSYQIRSSKHTVSWGASGSTGEVLAYIAPLLEVAASGSSTALAAILFGRLYNRLSGIGKSRKAVRPGSIGLEDCEGRAMEYLRIKFGQEAAISLICATKAGDSAYALVFECNDLRVEVIAGAGGNVFGYRRL